MRIANCKLQIANCRQRFAVNAQPVRFGPQLSTLNRQPWRRGFTLIELLIVITILAILAGLVVGVASVAGQTGRDAKTRNMIARLHTLLMEHYNSFKTRRVELNPDVVSNVNNTIPPGPMRGKAVAAARLYAIREMVLMEVPDRWSDILLAPVPNSPMGVGDARPQPLYLAQRSALAQTFLRRYAGLKGRMNTVTGSVNTGNDIKRFQGAECLYMVIMLACGDGEARSLFSESDIGDVDGDGAPEFLDAWGHPIDFLRWAPGFDSLIQHDIAELAAMASTDRAMAIAADHDPFDLFRSEEDAFRLVPLIYSPGRDEQYGVIVGADPSVDPNYIPWPQPPAAVVSVTLAPPHFNPRLLPYFTTLPAFIGTAANETATDNIHNHLIGGRL
jgi:prepilin-type N-terminal cleavage/methylation domain-containing protein